MSSTPWGGVAPAVSHSSLRGVRGLAIRNAETAAWLVLVPCAALVVAAIALLGPPVGHLLIPANPAFHFFYPETLSPHPAAQGRFLVSLAGPIVLAAAIVLTVRRQPLLPARLVAVLVAATQALVVVAFVVCFAGQRQPQFDRDYFTNATLVASASIALLLLALARSARARRPLQRLLRETRPRWLLASATAAALTAVWMLHAVNDDNSVEWAADVIPYHVAFHLDETFALLNGLTPLVSFTPQYGALWPYVVALPMLAFGKTLLVFTIAMCTITGLSLLGIFGVFRRVTRSSVAALLLFLPFLATSLFLVRGTMDDRFTLGAYFAMFPLRFAGPFMLAWLTARHLSRPTRGRPWPLFAAAGVVALNNADFGFAALGATGAALLWTTPAPLRGRSLLRLAANAAAGVAIGIALVSLLTLIRSGSLPQLSRLTEFARIYGRNGFSSIPIASARGLPSIIYGTYVAAIATATVLALRGERNRVLTGMLTWAGVFGLGAAVYYVTRAHPDVLVSTFPPWSLALLLLAVVVLRGLATRPLRQTATGVLVLFGVGLACCSIAQFPWPQTQLERIRHAPQGSNRVEPLVPGEEADLRAFVAGVADGPRRFVVRHGTPVAILETTGHRMADAYGVRDIVPYTGFDSILTVEQLEAVLDTLRDAGGNTVVMSQVERPPFNRVLIRRGFQVVTRSGLRPWPLPGGRYDPVALAEHGVVTVRQLTKWVDTHHLRPRALRAAQP